MARPGLAAAGLLLLLALSASALRTQGHGAQPQGPGGAQDATDEALSRRSEIRRTRTLHTLVDEIKSGLRDVELVDSRAYVERRRSTSATAKSARCSMGTSSCSLADLQRGQSVSIYPGGRTRCIFGEEFFFQVWPGDEDKLMIHLDGGGACWDQVTTDLPSCIPSPYVPSCIGTENPCPGYHPFEGYTAIFVNHCSGDLFGGSVNRSWSNTISPDAAVKQRGYDNFRAVLDWAKANMAPNLTHISFEGESAGAIGTLLWARTLLTELHSERATILADSYVGIFPEEFEGPVFKGFGTCELGLLPSSLLEKCRSSNLTVIDFVDVVIQEFPNVVFGHINWKWDSTQMMFHDVAASSQRMAKAMAWCGDEDPWTCDLTEAPPEIVEILPAITYREYHRRIERILERYSRHPNYVSYLLSGDSHGALWSLFGDCPMSYEPVRIGTSWDDGKDGVQRLSSQQWVRQFFESSPRKNSGCQRLRPKSDDDYCEDKQALKRIG